MVDADLLNWFLDAVVHDERTHKQYKIATVSEELSFSHLDEDTIFTCVQSKSSEQVVRLQELYLNDPPEFEIELSRLYTSPLNGEVLLLHSYDLEIGYFHISLHNPSYHQIVSTMFGLANCGMIAPDVTVDDNVVIIN